jgi:hypothetical protein
MEQSQNHKGWYWDHVNKQMYRWHDLRLLMQERKLKKKNNEEFRNSK